MDPTIAMNLPIAVMTPTIQTTLNTNTYSSSVPGSPPVPEAERKRNNECCKIKLLLCI